MQRIVPSNGRAGRLIDGCLSHLPQFPDSRGPYSDRLLARGLRRTANCVDLSEGRGAYLVLIDASTA